MNRKYTPRLIFIMVFLSLIAFALGIYINTDFSKILGTIISVSIFIVGLIGVSLIETMEYIDKKFETIQKSNL